MELNGMTALVTGGAAGIGAGIAERLAAAGMHVVVADRDEEAGPVMAERIGGSFRRTDVADRADIHAAAGAAGPIAVLVNNAGGFEEPCFPAADPAAWEQSLDLNLRAVMLATQLVLAPMRARGGGAIINIASTAGLGTAAHASPEYAVAKAGVVRFTTCLAPLRDTMGVRVNCICPGLVDTPASRRTRARMTPAELAALPSVLSPADIAAAAMEFLADDTLAGRIMLCRRGGEPPRLLPVTDGQELPSPQGGLDDAAEGDQPLLAAGRADELKRGGQPRGAAGDRQDQGGQAGQVGRHGQHGERHALLAQVVFRPAIPQQAAGIRTEPPVSVPRAASASPAATATAEPLDDPPGTRRGSAGFTGVPDQGFTPLADQHSSVRLVLPAIRAPARLVVATTAASLAAGLACSATTWQPAVVGRPSMSMQSLTASRGPSPGASRRTIQTGSMGRFWQNLRSHGRFAWTSWRLRRRDLLISHRVTMRVEGHRLAGPAVP